MRSMNRLRLAAVAAGLYGILALAVMSSAAAKTAAEIDAGVEAARDQCAAQVPGCNAAAEKAQGMLVFPEVTKAGIGVGSQVTYTVARAGSEQRLSATLAPVPEQVLAQWMAEHEKAARPAQVASGN